MIPKFFIERPVLANVLAILMVVIGAVALFRLPVAQYPDVVPPTVQVTTRYPGASARTVIDTIALPIEQQVNGVEGMIYMQSYAGADGRSGRIVARTGLRMMPTFPRSPLTFRKASFPRYG
jgi:hydrophobic/amphiphilic exporter-1 (mainly G- bacteria), HAE1 family